MSDWLEGLEIHRPAVRRAAQTPAAITANYVASPGDLLFVNSAGGPVSVTLPSGVSIGATVRIATTGAATNNVTIIGTVQGITGNPVLTYDDDFSLWYNGTSWQSVGKTILLPETVALRQRMTVKPDSDRIAAINTGISALKANGLWSKIGWLSVMAAHDEQAGRLNWVNPLQILASVGLPQWVRDYGFKGDGQSSYFTTNVALNAIPNFSRDSACMGVYVPDNTGSASGIELGVSPSYIQALNSTNMGARANHAGGSAQTLAQSTAFGFSYWSRQSSSSYDMGRNLVAPTQKSVASEAVSSSVVQVCRVSGTSYSSKPISLVVIGSMTSSEMQTFYSAFLVPYMTALGVPVP